MRTFAPRSATSEPHSPNLNGAITMAPGANSANRSKLTAGMFSDKYRTETSPTPASKEAQTLYLVMVTPYIRGAETVCRSPSQFYQTPCVSQMIQFRGILCPAFEDGVRQRH